MCRNMPFKIYTENRYMRALSLAIVSISISIAIGDGTETWSIVVGTVVCSHLYDICVLFKSPVLCGVMPRLYCSTLEYSRAEVNTS